MNFFYNVETLVYVKGSWIQLLYWNSETKSSVSADLEVELQNPKVEIQVSQIQCIFIPS